jgi:hypothetical protein
MLPTAFRYEYEGMEGGLIKLKCFPNPGFHPTNREAEVFHHMDGILWVNPEQKRLAGIDGNIISEVRFGGGLLGHLDGGGTFSVCQKEVGPGHWEMTSLNVDINGKVLFFKTIAVREKEFDTDFQRVPQGITLESAVMMLRLQSPEVGSATP